MKNMRKDRSIKLAKTERKKKYYKTFHRRFISYRNEKHSDINEQPVYLGLSTLDY